MNFFSRLNLESRFESILEQTYERHLKHIIAYDFTVTGLFEFILNKIANFKLCHSTWNVDRLLMNVQTRRSFILTVQKNDLNPPASVHRLTAIEHRHIIPPRGYAQHGHACVDARFSCTRLELRYYDNLDNKSRGTCIPTSNWIFQKIRGKAEWNVPCFIEFCFTRCQRSVKTL